MRKIALLAVLALAAVPAAFAENSPSAATPPNTLCKQQRDRDRHARLQAALRRATPTANASRRPPSAASQNATNAAKLCAAERADAGFAAAHDGKTFAQFYGNRQRPQRIRQVRLQQGSGAHRRTAAGHDQRCEDLQGRAHEARRRPIHGEVRRPLERLREMRRQGSKGEPVNGFATRRGALNTPPTAQGGAPGAPLPSLTLPGTWR